MANLILSNGSNSFNLTNKVKSFSPHTDPSFSFIDLANGKIAKGIDLGAISDKFHTTLEIYLSFADCEDFIGWFNAYARGNPLSISTDLDIFFPNVYSYGQVIIISYRDAGLVGDTPNSRYRLFEIDLYHIAPISYSPQAIPQTLINSKGIFTWDFKPSDNFNLSAYTTAYSYTKQVNDSLTAVLAFDSLTKAEAGTVLAWILTQRASAFNLNLNAQQSGFEGVDVNGITRTRKVLIHDFTITPKGNYYSIVLDLVSLSDFYNYTIAA